MEMEKEIRYLDALLKEGKTGDVLKIGVPLCNPHSPEFQEATQEQCAELQAVVGMAYYRRKEFENAQTYFNMSLVLDPANERALYGMAYLAAYVDCDSVKTREWMEKLPESAARDNAWMIILRTPEYYDMQHPLMVEGEVEKLAQKHFKPNPSDPLNTANIMHNAGRFFIAHGDKCMERDTGVPAEEKRVLYMLAVGVLQSAIGLYGTGDQNLHHRAAAHYWLSVAQEKLLGPAAAIAFAEQSVELWDKQLDLDPENPHYQKSRQGAADRLRELTDAVSSSAP
jgi:tetratricopeptide (TPR) repeat protein